MDEQETEKPVYVKGQLTNDELRALFPDTDGKLTVLDTVLFVVLIGALVVTILLLFSGVAGLAYGVYEGLMRMEFIWWQLIFGGLAGAFVLHVCNWYHWPLKMKIIPAALVLYVFFAGMVCHAQEYPAAPLIVCTIHFPIFTALLRHYTSHKTSQYQFYLAMSAIYLSFALIALLVWIIWIFAADMEWGTPTKNTLQDKLSGIHDVYEINWLECQAERDRGDNASATDLKKCADIEVTGFLIWVCPLMEFSVLSAFAVFCFFRTRMLATLESEKAIKALLFMLCCFACAFWVATATAGASMGLSELYLIIIGVIGLIFATWLMCVIDLDQVLDQGQQTNIFKTFTPMLRSDYFTALIFCVSIFAIAFFLMMEVFVRQLQRLLGFQGKSPYITDRGNTLIEHMRLKHWASTLEKAWLWCLVYMTFFVFTKFTPVFLSWLGTALGEMPFGAVIGIFYFVGLCMFLLPPVPGVPVYMAAGTIIVVRGKQEPWLSFWSGVGFASVLALLLKLNAVAIQQKIIGEGFGRSLWVQQLVGVHTTSIRAIEKILKKPGMTLEKVAILCGGPDWPTSVTTGIIKCNLAQMLLGTLPCFFLIVPCVIGGASLYEPSLKSFSPMIILVVGASQGAVMLMAIIFIAKETERSMEELSKPLPEHAVLIQKSEEAALKTERYKKFTQWIRLNFFQKFFLLSAVFAVLVTCWAAKFLGSTCFRKFDISGQISDPFSKGGLDKNPLNLIKPPGWAILGLMGFGIVLYIIYQVLTKRRARSSVEGEEQTIVK